MGHPGHLPERPMHVQQPEMSTVNRVFLCTCLSGKATKYSGRGRKAHRFGTSSITVVPGFGHPAPLQQEAAGI
jgi:hypothetical protein